MVQRERWFVLVLLAMVLGLLWDRGRISSLQSANDPVLKSIRKEVEGNLRTANEESSSPLRRLQATTSTTSPSTCSKDEFLFQLDNFELVGLHICDSDRLWELMQLALPDSRIFLDIGGNLGYTASRIFGLWSPGHKFNRRALRKSITDSIHRKQGLTNNTRQTSTFCRDGNGVDAPMLCVGHQRNADCIARRNIEVYSFDGQALHVENQKRVVYHYFPHLNPQYDKTRFNDSTAVRATWEYVHSAMTDSLAASGERMGYFMVNDNEHGMLVKEKSAVDKLVQESKPEDNLQFVEVPILTIDLFVREKALPQVDVIKVDAEGSDVQVLMGALETIRTKGVKVLTFECSQCLNRDKYASFFELIDKQYGFDCYLHGVNQLVVKMTSACWDYDTPVVKPPCHRKCPAYLHHKSPQAWAVEAMDSNAYCVHRTRAAALHTLVDGMSLHHYANPQTRGHFLKDAFLSVEDIEFDYGEELSEWHMKRGRKDTIWYHRMYGRDPKTGVKLGVVDSAIG